PTRVIDVGSVSAEPSFHIPQPGERAPYCALSHCWGPPDPAVPRVVTTRDNFEEHRKKIPLQTLSQTFRQAVEVVKELGVQFLWIDSLCIVQDDADDWAQEASRMGLAILSKKTARKQQTIYGFEYMFINHAAKDVYPCIHRYSTRKPHERAWCVQERALASRIVHFCDVEIFWECRYPRVSQPFCVCGANASIGGYDYQELRLIYTIDWQCIVRTYTRRNITYGTDKLPALGGLARRFPIPDSAYIACIWHKTICTETLRSTIQRALTKVILLSPVSSMLPTEETPGRSIDYYHVTLQVGLGPLSSQLYTSSPKLAMAATATGKFSMSPTQSPRRTLSACLFYGSDP
ncbi:HET-domain-containing protein, partial [Lentithecium fluviatile CBS 122367]